MVLVSLRGSGLVSWGGLGWLPMPFDNDHVLVFPSALDGGPERIDFSTTTSFKLRICLATGTGTCKDRLALRLESGRKCSTKNTLKREMEKAMNPDRNRAGRSVRLEERTMAQREVAYVGREPSCTNTSKFCRELFWENSQCTSTVCPTIVCR